MVEVNILSDAIGYMVVTALVLMAIYIKEGDDDDEF